MAITDYSTLQTAVGEWLHRTDLATQIPTFIQLAETKIANNIRSRQLETTTTLVTTDGVSTVALPSDYGSFKNLQIAGYPPLTLVPDDILLLYNSSGGLGVPQFYCLQGNDLVLSPVPNSELTINVVYYKDLTPLSSINPVNWVLTKYPAVYLYGALIEASIFTNDPEQQQFYQTKFNDTIEDMWRNFGYESFSGSALRAYSRYIV